MGVQYAAATHPFCCCCQNIISLITISSIGNQETWLHWLLTRNLLLLTRILLLLLLIDLSDNSTQMCPAM